jgi:hypothetical protein
VQRNIASGFEDSFRRHLAVEQRRAVLDTIAHELTPDTTLGDIVDAAHDLGWADGLGELCLADLAVALFGDASPDEPVAAEAPLPRPALPHVDADDDDNDELADSDSDDDADEDADDDETAAESEDEDDDEPAARSGRKPSSLDRAVDRIEKTLAAARKVRSKKAAAKVAGKKLAKAAARIPTPVPAAKPAKGKAAAKAVPAKVAAPVKAVKAGRAPIDEDEDEDDDTEAMSLDQAAKLLVPLVRKLREATMQDLEEQTKMGRRKLRFHIGQLVKHGKLRRHGMGRGTCYTVK